MAERMAEAWRIHCEFHGFTPETYPPLEHVVRIRTLRRHEPISDEEINGVNSRLDSAADPQ